MVRVHRRWTRRGPGTNWWWSAAEALARVAGISRVHRGAGRGRQPLVHLLLPHRGAARAEALESGDYVAQVSVSDAEGDPEKEAARGSE